MNECIQPFTRQYIFAVLLSLVSPISCRIFSDRENADHPIGQAEMYLRFLQQPTVNTNITTNRMSLSVGDVLNIKGTASNGYPSSMLLWSVGGSAIETKDPPPCTPTPSGLCPGVTSTLGLNIDPSDDNKALVLTARQTDSFGATVETKKSLLMIVGSPGTLLSSAQTAGIVMGVLLFMAIVVFLFAFLVWKRRKKPKEDATTEERHKTVSQAGINVTLTPPSDVSSIINYDHNFQRRVVEPPTGLRVLEVRQAPPFQEAPWPRRPVSHDPYEDELDQTQVYAYEGRGSLAGSLSSLSSNPSHWGGDLDIWGLQDEGSSSTLQGSCCDPACIHQTYDEEETSTDADEYEFGDRSIDSDHFRTYAIENHSNSPMESWV